MKPDPWAGVDFGEVTGPRASLHAQAFEPPVPIGRVDVGELTPNLKESIERAIDAQMPASARGAVVAVADAAGLRFSLATRIDDHWRLVVGAGKVWGGPVSGTVLLMGSW